MKIIPFGRFTTKELVEGAAYYSEITADQYLDSEGEDLGWWRIWLLISAIPFLIMIICALKTQTPPNMYAVLVWFAPTYACWQKSREHKLIVFLHDQQKQGKWSD